MKKLIIIYILIFQAFLGCDKSFPLELNGKKEYKFYMKCGEISLKGSKFSNWIVIYQNINYGEFNYYFDSLSVQLITEDAIKIDTLRFYDQNGLITEKFKKITDNQLIRTYVLFDKPIYGNSGVLVINAGGYIKCNDIPLISNDILLDF